MELLGTSRDILHGGSGSNTCREALPKFPILCHLSIKNQMFVCLRYVDNKGCSP